MRDEAIAALNHIKQLVPYMLPDELKEFEKIEMKAINGMEKKEDIDNLFVIVQLITERMNRK